MKKLILLIACLNVLLFNFSCVTKKMVEELPPDPTCYKIEYIENDSLKTKYIKYE